MFPYLQEIHQFSYSDYSFMPRGYYNSPYSERWWFWSNGALESIKGMLSIHRNTQVTAKIRTKMSRMR
ncbi:hypothetical protein SAMN05421578_13421 [Paenibacillus macquariensis]|uniref:Uncharacterized protein n=1 Tax=Paenibacillus macquariensis TaxID=948756 RepID=A0ABY1KGR3_9BACL|nr:hypothetical protein SAMN05421578_13421 [Paenibacillus macquariensis]